MLIASRSPLRISFFGGGTDYPEYFKRFPGAVLGAAINKYVYTVVLPMADFAEHKYRITYRVTEAVDSISEIKHNAVRAILTEYGFDRPLNISILSDIPGNSGLGSSSSFTVGFIKLIEYLKGTRITKLDLMRKAVMVEHDILAENVGIQDQSHAAFGGLSYYSFHEDDFSIRPVRLSTANRDDLNRSLVLVYTGVQRHASQILEEQIRNTAEKRIDKELRHLVELCRNGLAILESRQSPDFLRDFGSLLSEGWKTKRSLSESVSTPLIDEIFEAGISDGAYGGKLCGAGNGGFFLFLAPPHVQQKLSHRFGAKNIVKIEIEEDGATILTN